MLVEALIVIFSISIAFCILACVAVCLFNFLFTEEKEDVPRDNEVFEAKHYYDPLPPPSPPDIFLKPTPYSFKLQQNGNGVYSTGMPQAVINPQVLQSPIPRRKSNVWSTNTEIFGFHNPNSNNSHSQQRVPPPHSQTQVKPRPDKELNTTHKSRTRRRSRSRSRSPKGKPSPPKNVWSTETDNYGFHNHTGYYPHQQPPQYHYNHQPRQHYQHPPTQYQEEFQRQYVQLTNDHYPVHHVNQKVVQFSPEEYLRHQISRDEDRPNKYEPFMASSHATNVAISSQQQLHSPRRKSHRSKSRHKDAVT